MGEKITEPVNMIDGIEKIFEHHLDHRFFSRRERNPIPTCTLPLKGRGSKKEATGGVCIGCGCTDERACPQGCFWMDGAHTICSVCWVKAREILIRGGWVPLHMTNADVSEALDRRVATVHWKKFFLRMLRSRGMDRNSPPGI